MRARLFWTFVAVLAALGTGWTSAQSLHVTPVTPTVVSGADLGFRIEGNRGGTPVGSLVVRMNGQWVEAQVGAIGRPQRITNR